jgi:hypothetical protein
MPKIKKVRMPTTKINRWGDVKYTGLRSDFAAYERSIFNGKIPCPFKVEHKDRYGVIVSTSPIPLKSNGVPKINLFGE